MGAVGGPKTGGRKKGTPNKRTTERKAAVAAVADRVNAFLPDAFMGDAHAYLIALYKDPKVDPRMRLDAAKAALGYEKPRLASVEMTQRSLDDLSPTEFLELWGKLEAMVGAGDAAAGDASAGAQERTELRALQSGQGGKSGQAH